MFKKDMLKKLENIFKFKKTTFDAHSDEFEQDTLFIEVQECKERITSKGAVIKVIADLIYFSQVDRIKYGNMIKLIEQANPIDKNPFFFYDIDKKNVSSQANIINITERRISCHFFYTGEYDPEKGEITSLDMDCCNN